MKSFIRAVELWVPDESRGSLEFKDGLYADELAEFREISELAIFAYDEGLPGKAWAARHPIILTEFADSYFRRADEARLFGLTCGVAIPIVAGDEIKAVLGLLCGSDKDANVGAVELWHNEAESSHELTLVDGYYGTADSFEFDSRHTTIPRGYGLPGRAWKADEPVIIEDLGDNSQFMRAKEAALAGMAVGLAIPYQTNASETWVISLLSAAKTPIARRFEIWTATDDTLSFQAGHCSSGADLLVGFAGKTIDKGEGSLGEAWATGLPVIASDLTSDRCCAARAAIKAGLKQTVVLPVMRDGAFSAAIAWYP
jgi:hypothetical protein